MKICLLGYGKMGKQLEGSALLAGHEIVAKKADSFSQLDRLSEADVCIDFSHPRATIAHLELASSYRKPLVIGTTGWQEQYEVVKKIALEKEIGVLFAANFSLGLYLFSHILKEATRTFAHFPEYDVAGVEMHHRHKQDAPSGTALQLTQIIGENMAQKTQLHPAGAPFFSSVRCGDIPGSHAIIFDSPIDTITLTHEARNRGGFAQGALHAAQWLIGKRGWFSLEDYMNSLMVKTL